MDPDALERERARARELRASPWWKRRIAAGDLLLLPGTGGPACPHHGPHRPPGARRKSVRGNVVPACKECNSRKKSMLPVEWQEYLDHLARID